MGSIRILATASLLLIVCHANSQIAEKSDAPATAKRFYETLLKLHPDGLPTADQMKQIGPFLSNELNKSIGAARKAQQQFIKEHPDDKPPLIEGNLFASMYEGIDSFSLGTPVFNADKASFPVTLEYRESGKTFRWIDVVVLEKANGEWKIWDIFLNGPWDFRSGPSLRAVLSSK